MIIDALLTHVLIIKYLRFVRVEFVLNPVKVRAVVRARVVVEILNEKEGEKFSTTVSPTISGVHCCDGLTMVPVSRS